MLELKLNVRLIMHIFFDFLKYHCIWTDNGKKSLLVPRFPAVMALVSGVKYASTSDRI